MSQVDAMSEVLFRLFALHISMGKNRLAWRYEQKERESDENHTA